MPIKIRSITEAECPAVADLCEAAYVPFVSGDHEYLESLRDVAGRAREAEVLVATFGRALYGTVTYVPDGGPLGEIAGPDEAEFRMLAVAPSAQGRGVGMALMRWVVDTSVERGLAGIVCSSLPTMTSAHRIYERLGFRRAPDRDWSPVPGVDLMAFALRLL